MQFPIKILISLVLALLLFACNNTPNDNIETNKQNPDKSLVKVNKYLVRAENEEIENYVNRRGWEMKETGSGLRYQVFEQGVGPAATKGQLIEMEYELRLITGDIVYSSAKDGLKSFIVGHGGVEAGLEEAVLFLRKGDKAHIIFPSHLAYGLLGDQKRIPSRSTLIYEVNIINLK